MPVSIHDVPESGRHVNLAPDETVRETLAKAIGLRSLPRLEASFDVTRHGRDGLRVSGQVSATVGQTCVVTLEPLENAVSEPVDVIFVPRAATAEDDSARVVVESDAALAADDAPEPLIGGVVDLGVIATEFLTLAIDPYPRKPDAVFEAPRAADDESAHPFAALAALKKDRQK